MVAVMLVTVLVIVVHGPVKVVDGACVPEGLLLAEPGGGLSVGLVPVGVFVNGLVEGAGGTSTMTVPVGSPEPGGRVTVVGAVIVEPVWVMVVQGPVNVPDGTSTMTVPVGSPESGG